MFISTRSVKSSGLCSVTVSNCLINVAHFRMRTGDVIAVLSRCSPSLQPSCQSTFFPLRMTFSPSGENVTFSYVQNNERTVYETLNGRRTGCPIDLPTYFVCANHGQPPLVTEDTKSVRGDSLP